MTISGIKSNARQALKGNLGSSNLMEFLAFLLTLVSGATFTSGPMMAASADFYMSLLKGDKKKVEKSIDTGFRNFGRAFVIFLITYGFTMLMILPPYGWLIAFVVLMGLDMLSPITFIVMWVVFIAIYTVIMIFAIWFSHRMQFAYHIMLDNPKFTGWQCFKESFRLMKGKVGKSLLLTLSFILWRWGTILTFGLLAIYARPYEMASASAFYLELIAERDGATQASADTTQSQPQAVSAPSEPATVTHAPINSNPLTQNAWWQAPATPPPDTKTATQTNQIQKDDLPPHCPYCKKVYDKDTVFCSVCGHRVN